MSTTFTPYPCSSTCTRPKTVHGCTLMRYDQCDAPLASFQDSLLFTPAHAPSRSSAGGGGGRRAEHTVRASQRSAKVCCLHSAALRMARVPRLAATGRKQRTKPFKINCDNYKRLGRDGKGRESYNVTDCTSHAASASTPGPPLPPLPPLPRQFWRQPGVIMTGGSPARSWPWWRLSRPWRTCRGPGK